MRFYRSQFWRLQKQPEESYEELESFIGHNFGDYKNRFLAYLKRFAVLSVTILETTKTQDWLQLYKDRFYRSQFWRLQKLISPKKKQKQRFIGHNFGDYKNMDFYFPGHGKVLSVTILETTKTHIVPSTK